MAKKVICILQLLANSANFGYHKKMVEYRCISSRTEKLSELKGKAKLSRREEEERPCYYAGAR